MPLTRAPEAFGLTAETLSFSATDGALLEAWKIAADPERPWIIMCHGLGSNRADLLEIAAGLHRAGLNLLLVDFRGHGGSAGHVTSFGWRERLDLAGALAWLGRQADIPPKPYGIYGISMGGSAALLVAAEDERLGAVAVDSPYAGLEGSILHHVRLLYPWLPAMPFHWFILATYRIRFGIWPAKVSPEDSLSRLGTRPVLLINGAVDARMLPEQARRMVEHTSGPHELWIIPGAAHLQGYALQPRAYLEKLVKFFREALG